MRTSLFMDGSVVAKVLISILILLSQFAVAVDLVIKRDSEASKALPGNKGWNIYLGHAEWNNDPGFLTNDGAFIALAQKAFKVMRDQAKADGVPNPPSAVSVLIAGNKAYIASSITNTERGGGYKPGGLLALFRQPLYEQDTLAGPTPPFGLSQVVSTLHQCLEEAQKNDPDATEHEMFCGEPVALELYFNSAGLPGQKDKSGMRNARARIVTWGTANGQEFVFRPCTGGRPSAPNSIGCSNLVTFLGLPFISSGNPANDFPQPDSAKADTLCLDDGDLSKRKDPDGDSRRTA